MTDEIIHFLEEELAESMGSEFTINRKEAVGGGCINHAFRLYTSKGSFFLKWNHSCADDLFVREAECLSKLKERSGDALIVPEVILAREAEEMAGFILMEDLESGTVSKQDEKLGQGLAHLHRVQAGEYGFDHDNYCGETPQVNSYNESWIDFFTENRLRWLLRLIQNSREISSRELHVFEDLIDRLPSLIPDNPGVSLIHGDLWSGNYLYTAKGPAVIDPASYYAHREMELSLMTMFGGFSPKVWAAYQEGFPLEPGWEERVQLYQIYHQLNHYYLFGGGYGQQALSMASRFL